MRRFFLYIALTFSILFIFSCHNEPTDNSKGELPLNISVYLDLSDRLVKDLTPSQTYRDTAIINYIVDFFVKQTMGPQILKSQNKMKVLFYPTPNNSEIATLAQGLNVDIGSKQGVERRKTLDSMSEIFNNNLSHIYQETVEEHNWIGCDIWDFFSSKKVDNLCIKSGFRNIVVILTDGYLIKEDNLIREGDSYSYLSDNTLMNGGKLIDRRGGELKGKSLEVLMLEVNPSDPKKRDKMICTLEDWFESMGVEKFVVAETDANISNTKMIIDNFLLEQ